MRNDNNIKLSSPLEIQAIIKKINSKKATGPDGIPNKALKMIPPNLLTCITKVFNKCLLHHYFPPSWKIAHVLMFPKPGQNHKLPGNYRPISLLSNLGKIYEKVILARLKEHSLIYKSFLMSNMASAPTTAVYISFFVLPT
ncbi:hypothetical protein AVEN_173395-1 [Araneus ventricosus]|uniref:RNA-directed DNA polymerase from transposon X-element n=2 Tax=Araneus ventricosus TaxID=182803 RepID=A0A4Y2QEC7_ARAVE|nr:hypothetical protein AVEN_173395-1 [Araneus ventricosus]